MLLHKSYPSYSNTVSVIFTKLCDTNEFLERKFEKSSFRLDNGRRLYSFPKSMRCMKLVVTGCYCNVIGLLNWSVHDTETINLMMYREN